MTTAQKETLGFQAEVKQLLNLMIHSLYSNKEIFLRELISNSSDALDKLRFQALSNEALYEGDESLKIKLEFDTDANTVTLSDTGIGMSRDEIIENLGTIAKSGTAEFLSNLTGDQKKDSQLIGQFGVGFYSSFIVAQKVEVITRKAGTPISEGVHWESSGEGEFSIEDVEKSSRGTAIILHLKDDEKEFSSNWRLRSLVKKYSDHISFPVEMVKEDYGSVDEDKEDDADAEATEQAEKPIEFEVVNDATALWTLPKAEIKDEDYKEFYKHISHDFADPLTWVHNRVEGKLDYTSLLYIPSKAPFDMYNREAPRGLKLYIQRVFIMDDAEQFLPLYLRFVKGIVDSNDLSLNVSREILQNDKAVDSMRSALTKRVLDLLGKMAENEPEQYKKLWKEFGSALKEGPAEDYSNREKVAKLLRFASSKSDGECDVSLDDYIARMKPDQKKLYFITADSYEGGIHSPHIEIFKKKEIEVLVMHDRIDEWLMSHLNEFDGKAFQDVTKGELDLGDIEDEAEKEKQEQASKEAEPLIKRIKEVLGESVQDVRLTHRLTDSPACLVMGEHDMGLQMRKIMEAAGQPVPDSKPIFEINPEHPLVKRLESESDSRFDDLTHILVDQAKLAGGEELKDPSAYVTRMNKLLIELF